MRLRSCLPLLGLLVTACDGGRLVATFEESFTIDEARELVMENGAGDLSIVGEEGRTDVTLVVELRTFRSELRDDDAKEAVVLDVRKLDDASVKLVASIDHPPNGYDIDVTAFVPADAVMRVSDGSGDASIESLAALELDDDSGDLHIDGIAGNVAITDDSGDMFVDNVRGALDIEDDSGDLRVRDVSGDVHVRDGSGDISVSTVSGVVTVSDGSGDIFVGGAADVDIASDGSGDVRIE